MIEGYILDAIRERVPLVDVFEKAGVALRKSGAGFLGCCPFHADRSPSMSVTPARHAFFCHGCGAAGDVFEAVRLLHGVSFREAATSLAERAGIAIDSPRTDLPPIVRAPRAETPYPDPLELDAIARSCVPVTRDPVVADYLRSRSLDPELVERHRLAWALRRDAHAKWARTGHRMIVPLYDARGVRRSIVGRRVEGDHRAKTLVPRGRSSGLVFACPIGLHLLRGEPIASHPVVVIAEGEIDAITWRTHCVDAGAVLGIRSGSWCDELASRIPAGADVLVATDHDDAGERFARRIHSTLEARQRAGEIEVRRWAVQ